MDTTSQGVARNEAMTSTAADLSISTPGRICLFGEHQDYLQLPVIPCAISLRVTLAGSFRRERTAILHLPDVGREESFPLDGIVPYSEERDYFKSAVNVMKRRGFTFSRGFECTVHGEIPINSGTSSSTALTVTWVNFLGRASDQNVALSPDECARIGHAAEVLEFGEPGGMMDHFSTAFGGTIFIRFHPDIVVAHLQAELGTFVLGDSGEPKDTKGILSRVKDQVLHIAAMLAGRYPAFSLQTTQTHDLDRYAGDLTQVQRELLRGTMRNRDITSEAEGMLRTSRIDHRAIGALLNEHQAVLRDVLRISTPKIDRMIDAGLNAGAYGGKINGSGGGGCMFVYAPEHAERVAAAIEGAGGRAFIVRADAGTRPERTETGA